MEKTIEGITLRREKAQAIYGWIEGAVKIILAATIKLAICGVIGMLAVCLIFSVSVSAYIWAAACAGCLAYRWLSRLVTIKPRKKKRR